MTEVIDYEALHLAGKQTIRDQDRTIDRLNEQLVEAQKTTIAANAKLIERNAEFSTVRTEFEEFKRMATAALAEADQKLERERRARADDKQRMMAEAEQGRADLIQERNDLRDKVEQLERSQREIKPDEQLDSVTIIASLKADLRVAKSRTNVLSDQVANFVRVWKELTELKIMEDSAVKDEYGAWIDTVAFADFRQKERAAWDEARRLV